MPFSASLLRLMAESQSIYFPSRIKNKTGTLMAH